MLTIADEGPFDGPVIEDLLDASFGPGRFRKTSYRYRIGLAPVQPLCLAAWTAGRLVGSIRYWPVCLDDQPALLLGPLAIDPARRGQGIGRALMRASLAKAEALGWRLVFLVGDPAYYAQHGFDVVPETIVMPGEDPARLQYVTLAGAALPAAGSLLLRLRPPGLLGGDPVEVAEQGRAHGGDALVDGHAVLHLPQPRGHGARRAGASHRPGQGLDQGADAEDHRPGPGQAAQGLPLHAQAEELARVLG